MCPKQFSLRLFFFYLCQVLIFLVWFVGSSLLLPERLSPFCSNAPSYSYSLSLSFSLSLTLTLSLSLSLSLSVFLHLSHSPPSFFFFFLSHSFSLSLSLFNYDCLLSHLFTLVPTFSLSSILVIVIMVSLRNCQIYKVFRCFSIQTYLPVQQIVFGPGGQKNKASLLHLSSTYSRLS